MVVTSTNQPNVIVVKEDGGFPTAAIVVLAIGGYMILFIIALIIRKCIITKGEKMCPSWCSEVLMCETACCCMNNNNTNDEGCITKCAQSCNYPLPYKRHCMECLPTKTWFDNTFCSGCGNQPGDDCCKCENANCGDCDGCFDCTECKECFDCDCKCDCCSQPDSIDCCCIEVKLSGNNRQQIPMQGYPNGGYPNHPGGGYANYPGAGGYPNLPGASSYSNQLGVGGFHNQPGGYINQAQAINQQPGYLQQSQQGFPSQNASYNHLAPDYFNSRQSFNQPLQQSFQPGQSLQSQMFSGGQQTQQANPRFSNPQHIV